MSNGSELLRIAAYVSPLTAYSNPTGVGQHILGMFEALQARPDVAFTLLSPRRRQAQAQRFVAGHDRSRTVNIPLADRSLRLATTWTSLISLDRWLDDVDWVYTPVEQPVTTKRHLAVTVHDLYPFEPSVSGIPGKQAAGQSWRRRMKRILNRADLILTVSEFTKSRMLALLDVKHPERIKVLGNGGSEEFSPRRTPEDGSVLHRFHLEDSRYVLFPASLTRRKGGDLLLEVAALAHREQTGLRFVVIGRRHDADLLRAMDDLTLRVPDLPVNMLGYVAKEELAVLYRHAVAALFPSRYEGFGIPVLESLASGCPILIAPQPALLEVANGLAVVIEADASSVLARLTAHLPRPSTVGRETLGTWAACADRLVKAMQ